MLKATLKQSTHVAYQHGLAFLQDHTFISLETYAHLDATIEQGATLAFCACPDPVVRRKVVNGVAALCHRLPLLRDRLPLTRRALAGWNRLLNPQQASPISRVMLKAFAGFLINGGNSEAAACVAVAWSALLRI